MVTHDISEAISMSDRVVVLTNRPGTVNKIHEIDFEMENRNPINCRKVRNLVSILILFGRSLMYMYEKNISEERKKILKTNK